MIFETVLVGPMQVNCYILAGSKNSGAVIIDPGQDEKKIRDALNRHRLWPAMIINTHGHYDHIGCDDKFGLPVYIHAKDRAMLKNPALNFSSLFALPICVKAEIRELKDNEAVNLEGIRLEVIHVPGHTAGGIALHMQKPTDKILFTGDSLFCQGIGRTDFPGADEALLKNAIREKLLVLAEDTAIYPGHGPSSTIGEEKRNNPFLA